MPDAPPTSPLRVRKRSPWPWRRIGAVAGVTFRQGVRLRIWVLAPLAVLFIVLADLSSPRFDPVFDVIPAAVGMGLLVMTVVAIIVAVFFATYSLPAEIESRVAYTVVTKPLSRIEFVAGKTAGTSLLVLAALAAIAAGTYGYVLVRAVGARQAAEARLAEVRRRVRYPADLNALEAVSRHGPLQTYRYWAAEEAPAIRIHFADEWPGDADVRWALAETWMRLSWDLSEAPLREWLATGPAAVRLRLQVRPPTPEAAPGPIPIKVKLAPAEERRPRRPGPGVEEEEEEPPTTELTPSGEATIVLVPPGVEPPAGALQVPAEGGFHLRAWIFSPAGEFSGYALGARERSLDLAAPGRRPLTLTDAPAVVSFQPGEKAWLIGRSLQPRQQAVFRFADVPASALPAGGVWVELASTLSAWSGPMVETTAEAVFVNPRTGMRQTLLFTPELHHSSLVQIDPAVWHGGPLEVHLECHTDDNAMGLLAESVRLRAAGGPFAWNLAKATLCLWLFGTVVASAGVALSTRLSWFVSLLAALTFLMVCMVRDFILRATPVGHAALYLAKWLSRTFGGKVNWIQVARQVVPPLPDLEALLPPEGVKAGEVLSLGALGDAFLWAALSVIIMVGIGGLLLRKREVGA